MCHNCAMDERTTEILLLKPERITGFDDRLTARLRSRIGSGDAALVEIAGRDSVAAAVLAALSGSYDVLVPTVVYTGTEYGDWNVLLENASLLGNRLKHWDDVEVTPETVFLGSPRWWHATGGRFAGVLEERYGFFTTCVACHMYFHTARVPFAREVGATAVVAGERLLHGGRRKLNQVGAALGSYTAVLEEAGIKLDLPLKETEDGSYIEELVGPWRESDKQMRCVLESNYRGLSGEFEVPDSALEAYLEGFLEPASRLILASFDSGESAPDYLATVEGVLWERSEP